MNRSRRNTDYPQSNPDRWIVSYADMLTLLFAVFVVLYAVQNSPQVAVSKDELAGAMQESFSTPLEDIPIHRRIGPTEYDNGVFEKFKGSQITENLDRSLRQLREEFATVIEQDLKTVKAQMFERLYGPDRFRKPLRRGAERIVDIKRTQRGFAIEFVARDFYKSSSYELKESSKKNIAKIVQVLSDLGRDITIEGHTDSKGSNRIGNWELSSMRAAKLAEYVIEDLNFPASRVSIAGYSDLRPLAHNGTEAGRQLNRRVEIHVNYDPNLAFHQEL